MKKITKEILPDEFEQNNRRTRKGNPKSNPGKARQRIPTQKFLYYKKKKIS